MRTIWKYRLPYRELDPEDSSCILELPLNSSILCVQSQATINLVFWVGVNTEEMMFEGWKFYIYGTGQEIPKTVLLLQEYLGTAQLYNGELVLHVFGGRI